MAFIESNGHRHWYEITGEGEPVVQIHGAALGHTNFAKVTPILNQHFKIYDFDLLGAGQSDRPMDVDYTLEMWADDVKGLMDTWGLEKAHIHGTSFGGMIS